MPTTDMIFGDPSDFAIQAGIEPELAPPTAPWGHTCVWFRGVALGDITDLHCGVGAVREGFSDLLANLDELWDESFEGLDDEAVWNLLDERLYGCHGDVQLDRVRSNEQIVADARRYRKFDFLTNWEEQFDGWKAFILCPPGSQWVRILYRDYRQRGWERADVSKAAVLKASREFVQWYDEQYRRLRAGRP